MTNYTHPFFNPPSPPPLPPLLYTAKVYALGEEVFTQELYPNLYSIWSEAEVVELFGSDSETCFVCEASDKTFLGFVLGTEIEVRFWCSLLPPSLPPSSSHLFYLSIDNWKCTSSHFLPLFLPPSLPPSSQKKGSSWRYGYLLWLAVSPKAQGLGVGRRLLKEFQDTMEENGCRLLLCGRFREK